MQVTLIKDDRGIDCLIVVVVPEADVMEQIDANTRTTIWLGLGVLILAMGLRILTSRSISITQTLMRLSTCKEFSGTIALLGKNCCSNPRKFLENCY